MEWYVILLFVLIVLNTPYVKGLIGELIVAIMLKFLNKDIYRVFHDLYIEKENGSTSQIDHVITSPFGIFVVETKNYKGWIFGSEKAKNWTQVIYRKKSKFLNPIIQNKGHIKHLSHFLKYEDKGKYHSIITFTGRATLKKINTTTPVVYTSWLVFKIKKYKEIVIAPEDLMMINTKLSSLKRADWKTRRQHVKDIKTGRTFKKATPKVVEDQESLEVKCPRCGAILVLRNSKRGEFYGCSSYPKCRFTKDS